MAFKLICDSLKKHHDYVIITVMGAVGIYFVFFDGMATLPFAAILLAVPKFSPLWLFKKHDASSDEKSQELVKAKRDFFKTLSKTEELEPQEGSADLQGKRDFWEKFTEVQESVTSKETTDIQKAAAIYKIGKFYAPGYINFVNHIHSLFKDCLEEFWKDNPDHQDAPKLPVHIELICHLIKHQSHQKINGKNFYNKVNGLVFADFQLRFANLSYVNFVNENLIHANLNHANLANTDSISADLSSADLTDINLTGANLTDTNLVEADLNHANLTKADLAHGYLAGANLAGANLTGANLTHTNLTRTNSTYVNFTRAALIHADLTYADLCYANLIEANLIGAKLNHAKLNHTNLSDANLSCAELDHADLSEADLTRANLIGADLRKTGNLNKAKLEMAMYCKEEELTTELPDNFNPEKHGMILANKFGERLR